MSLGYYDSTKGKIVTTAGSAGSVVPNMDTLKVLWENPSPTSTFAAKTINLSSSDYDYLDIYFIESTTKDYCMHTETLKGHSVDLSFVQVSTSGSRNNVRSLTRVSDKSFTFGDAEYQVSGSTTVQSANNLIIPLAIYGGKFNNDIEVNSVDEEIADIQESLTIVRKTLASGSTSIDFKNSRISTDSVFNVYTSIFGVSPSNISVSGTTVTLTFDSQTADMEVGLQILN